MSSPERELSLSEFIHKVAISEHRAKTQEEADAALRYAREAYPLPEHKADWERAFRVSEPYGEGIDYYKNGFSIILDNPICGSWLLFALENLNVGDTNPEDGITQEMAPSIACFLKSGKLPDILRKIPHILGKLDGDKRTLAYYVMAEVVSEMNGEGSFNRDFFDKFIGVMDTLKVFAIDRGDAGIVSEAQKAKITKMIANNINERTMGRDSEVPLKELLQKLKEYKIIDLGMMKDRLLERKEAASSSFADKVVMEAVLNDIDNILLDAGERRIIRSAGGGGAGGGSAGGSRPKFS